MAKKKPNKKDDEIKNLQSDIKDLQLDMNEMQKDKAAVEKKLHSAEQQNKQLKKAVVTYFIEKFKGNVERVAGSESLSQTFNLMYKSEVE